MYNWFSNLFSWNKKPSGTTGDTPRDPEAPIKNLIKNAPKVGGQLGENKKLRDELLGNYKKGGHVKKTGIYRLHKGEEVIPKKKAMAKKM